MQTGIVEKAPAAVFIAEAVTSVPLLAGNKTACIPAHSAVRTIAPKFLTSSIPSNKSNKGLSLKQFSIITFNSAYLKGFNTATIP